MSSINRIDVKVPNRSAHDKSFKNILTTKVGTITPLMCKYVMPGAKGHVRIPISACLPPLASDTFMRCSLKIEAFLIPIRLLYGGFESYLTSKRMYNSVSNPPGYAVAELPRLKVPKAHFTTYYQYFNPGSLLDYLDCHAVNSSGLADGDSVYFNIFPLLAYHRAFDDWYRPARNTNPIFIPPAAGSGTTNLSFLPYVASASMIDYNINDLFIGSSALGALRQRYWGDDYFTVAQHDAQLGTAVSVSSSSSFTIQALRLGNSLQQFAERSALASPRLQDYVKSHFGADLNSGVAQRAILLGSADYPVYSRGIEANADTTATNNPFTSVGARYGNGYASGDNFEFDYECNEPSYLLVNVSLVPEANYAGGVSREFMMFNAPGSQVDMPDPLLENIGNEEIFAAELSGYVNVMRSPGQVASIFGYVPKDTWYKSNVNQVHGLVYKGQSLDSFVAQRSFTGAPVIGSQFLEIPTTCLDNVTAVTGDLSTYGVWIDSYIDFKESCPLSESALPSLQNPAYEHGHSVSVHLGGSRI